MDRLDDDSLCYIFKYLKLKDQLNVTQASIHFCDVIVECIWSTKYRQLYTSRPKGVPKKILRAYDEVVELDREEYQRFYSMNVHHVEKLHIGNITWRAFSSYLGRYVQRPDFTFYFTYKYTRLIDLTCLDTNLHDGYIGMITKNCPMLQTLHVSSKYVTGKNLKDLKNLRHLNVSNCGIEGEYLDEIIAELDALAFLDVHSNVKLEQNVLKTWGRNLRELHIDEKQFFKQLESFPLPERLGNLKLLSIVCDPWELFRKEWMSFFESCGKNVKVFKILHKSESDIVDLQNVYNDALPRMQELHLKINGTEGSRLKEVFSSTKLRMLHLYNTRCLYEAFEIVKNSMQLNCIIIEDTMTMSCVDSLFNFIAKVIRLLQVQPAREDILIHLVEITQAIVPRLHGQIVQKFGSEMFNADSRVRIKVTNSPNESIRYTGRLEIEFH